MRILLIFPPTSDPAHPPLGLPTLAAFLRENQEEVKLLDLNIQSYYYFLSGRSLDRCKVMLNSRLADLESKTTLSLEEAKAYRMMVENSLSADYLQAEIEMALNALGDPSTYVDYSRYHYASSLVRRGMEFVSAAHYPVRWYPRGFSMSYLPTKSDEVLTAASDRKENLFISFFESCLPEITSWAADVIGISINYYCQLIPGITLASLLKSTPGNRPIIVGGGLITFLENGSEMLRPLSTVVDGFIPFEGEIPLLHLLKALKEKKSLSKVPGLIYFEGSSLKRNPPGYPPDPRTLPCPDFTDLPLDKYLSPQAILPLLASRGCYWGRCAFCSHDHLYREKFRQKTSQQVMEEIQTLAARFAANHFYFMDEAIPPAIAREIAVEINNKKLPYKWLGEIRFEPFLEEDVLIDIADGGCKMLMFGLESGEQRLLDLMNKGIKPGTASKILKISKKAGIVNFVMFFIGFPTETRQEAEKTLTFIESHIDCIHQVSFINFVLEKHAPVYAEPEKYGISRIKQYPREDLKIFMDYQVTEGLSCQEAIELVEEIKERPGIRSLCDHLLFSRTHLIFLPHSPKVKQENEGLQEQEINVTAFDEIYPRVREGLVAVNLPFNLDHIGEFLDKNDPKETGPKIEKCPSNYLFNPITHRLIEVGAHGFSLLKACSGSYSLADIITALGKENGKTAERFYLELLKADFLCR